jgi:hypothetical protein
MNIDYITFNEKRYKLRIIEHPTLGLVNIATTKLGAKLLIDDDYVNDEAQYIDEQIYFFIEPRQFGLSDERLLQITEQAA